MTDYTEDELRVEIDDLNQRLSRKDKEINELEWKLKEQDDTIYDDVLSGKFFTGGNQVIIETEKKPFKFSSNGNSKMGV